MQGHIRYDSSKGIGRFLSRGNAVEAIFFAVEAIFFVTAILLRLTIGLVMIVRLSALLVVLSKSSIAEAF